MISGHWTLRARRAAGILLVVAAALAAGCKYLPGHKAAAAPLPPARMVKLDSTVLNLSDTDKSAYLRIGVSLSVQAPAATDNDAELETIARDTIVAMASARSSEDLLSADGKAQLKKVMLVELQKRLPEDHVQELYFDEFLVQH